jgi:GNAT superfamily N-acetyltransferase
MEVREVAAIETLALRQRVLRPHQTLDELAHEDDDRRDAVSFAAIDAGAVIGTASVHREPPPWATHEPQAWRLRGMATDEARRHLGVGTAVLDAAVDYVREHNGDLLWCNARVTAIAFYQRAGFTTRGESWDEPRLGAHIAMQRRVPR